MLNWLLVPEMQKSHFTLGPGGHHMDQTNYQTEMIPPTNNRAINRQLTVSLSALVAWSRVNPIPMIMVSASSLGTKLPDFLAPPPGGTNGALKSEAQKITTINPKPNQFFSKFHTQKHETTLQVLLRPLKVTSYSVVSRRDFSRKTSVHHHP